MSYSLITWLNDGSRPETRRGLPYALAYALATKGGYCKAQVVSSWGVIEFEARS